MYISDNDDVLFTGSGDRSFTSSITIEKWPNHRDPLFFSVIKDYYTDAT